MIVGDAGRDMVNKAKTGKVFGIVLGTLGHQGNLNILNRIRKLLIDKGKVPVNFLMAELFPAKLKLIQGIDVNANNIHLHRLLFTGLAL